MNNQYYLKYFIIYSILIMYCAAAVLIKYASESDLYCLKCGLNLADKY